MDTLSLHADNSNIPLKQCKQCPEGQQWHPATLDYFSRDKQKKDGFCSICRVCRRRVARISDQKRQAVRKEYRQRPEVRERTRIWNNKQYTGIREYQRAYREDNRERLRAQRKEYYRRPEVHERALERARQQRMCPVYQEQFREYRKVYYQRPESKARKSAFQERRRARKNAVGGSYTPQEIQLLLIQQEYRCYSKRCGNAKFKRKKVNGIWQYEFHIDHIIPLSRTECHPTNDISNIGLLCPSCNTSKGNKLLSEWPEGGILIWDGGLVVRGRNYTDDTI